MLVSPLMIGSNIEELEARLCAGNLESIAVALFMLDDGAYTGTFLSSTTIWGRR